MSELLISITGQTITGHLSVDGKDFDLVPFVELARLLSDLACATTAEIVAGYEEVGVVDD